MTSLQINLPLKEASDKLELSLDATPNSRYAIGTDLGCYGNIRTDDGQTSFKIGIGPTDLTTACGVITQVSESESELTYDFEGPFWAFLKRGLLKSHFKDVFREHLVTQ